MVDTKTGSGSSRDRDVVLYTDTGLVYSKEYCKASEIGNRISQLMQYSKGKIKVVVEHSRV